MECKVNKPLWVDGNKRELIQWVIPGLPLTVFSHTLSPDTYDYLDWHWHEECQLCFPLKGNIRINVNDRTYLVTEGNGVFINCREMHQVARETMTAEYICMKIALSFPCQDSDYELCRKYKEPILGRNSKPSYLFTGADEHERMILDILHKIWTCFEEKTFGYELDMYQLLIKLWREFMLTIPRQPEIQEENKENLRLRMIIDYIRREYMNDISLDDIAAYMFLSKSECSRFFRKAAGQPLFAYLSEWRIYKSIELLTQTEKKVSVIAAETGFSSQSYYTECFKKQMGMTPNQFRKARRANREFPQERKQE